ncbi:DUF4221 family protein [Roseivirga sp.]|uniref:DUF4221 family protein n=1 Tax=Roseivirga sp. TaxID=1964215 RepID=UPI003B8AA634
MKAKLLNHTGCMLFLSFFVVSACGKREKTVTDNADAENTSITIVDGGIKTFLLDNEADFLNLQGLKLSKIDGKEYMTFYGRQAHAIYMYDYPASSLFRKISFKKNGPNAIIGGHEFFFHTMDSIFIKTGSGVKLINSKAEILTKRTAGSRQKNGITVISSDVPILHFDNVSKFDNGRIDMIMTLFNRTGEDYERAIFDFESNQSVDEFIQTKVLISNFDEILNVNEERRKRRQFNGLFSRHFASNENSLYGTTPISDSLFVFEGGKLLKTIYAGSPSVQVADYTSYAGIRIAEHFKNGMSISENPNQPPYYVNTLMSPDGDFIFRVLYHGTKPKFVEGKEAAIPDLRGATLIVLDLETEELVYYDLPVAEIDLGIPDNRHVFVTNRGIHFRVLDQENEDEVQFRLFELKR